MTSKLHLILAIHNHQPVGNFDFVLEECYRKAYLPFLQALQAHPSLKVVLHYSGHLMTWMEEKHPEATDIIRQLVHAGSAEMLSGGFYEPILTALPERDRVVQIAELSGYIKKHMGYAPKGMWLAERVWEPQMPRFISQAGMEYLPVDDYHFKLTGMEDRDLYGYYVTEDGGHRVDIFPGSEKLRYFIPFRPVDETLSYLKEVHSLGGERLVTMADDGEKFGVWPGTNRLCYEEGWLEAFFTALEENSDWVETTTFSEYRRSFRPLGMVYLPTASYREMGEWALPPSANLEYERALSELEKVFGERAKLLLRGGIWRSFMTKYPEANHLHKRMFMISRTVHEALGRDKEKGRPALTELMKGQCNDAYWHGIFGGLYLPHLRSSLYRHLLRAESAAQKIVKGFPAVDRGDFDCDGFEDMAVRTADLAACATEKGGSLTELSYYPKAVNVLDILSRRPEAYHSKISEAPDPNSQATKTIHDQFMVKESGLAAYLVYDGYRRASLLDRFFPSRTPMEDLSGASGADLGDFAGGMYSMSASSKGRGAVLSFSREGTVRKKRVRVEKTVTMSARELRVDYQVDGTFSGLFAVEMNMSLLGSPLVSIRTAGGQAPMAGRGVHKGLSEFSIVDAFLKLRLHYRFGEEIKMLHYPVETISLSEQGIERLYQGTAFLFMTDMKLNGSKRMWFTLTFGEDEL